jgi:hypothetical protein
LQERNKTKTKNTIKTDRLPKILATEVMPTPASIRAPVPPLSGLLVAVATIVGAKVVEVEDAVVVVLALAERREGAVFPWSLRRLERFRHILSTGAFGLLKS